MNQPSKSGLSRRTFVQGSTLLAASSVATLQARSGSAAGTTQSAAAADSHPFMTPANDFYTVARGNPKPHTLMGDALAEARMTPSTWRLEITADPLVDRPHVKQPATVEKPRTIEGGTALDLDALRRLAEEHGVRYFKAMQCLNIPTPLGQGLWEGVPLRTVLQQCGRFSNVRRIYYRGFHNNDPGQIFQSSLSYSQVMETPPGELPVFVAYRLNGEPIPPVRGGPVRMIVPWAHGFKSIKWLQQIFLTNDYRANDTYALNNNDPESSLKTAAYLDQPAKQVQVGHPVSFTGQVISGRSGVQRVEYWVRQVDEKSKSLKDDDPEMRRATWKPCQLQPPPDWDAILPAGVRSRDLLGFSSETGQPLTWPLPYAMASFHAEIRDLQAGTYELRARAVDRNGFAQPEPRSQQKSGKNAIQVRRFEVV